MSAGHLGSAGIAGWYKGAVKIRYGRRAAKW